MTCRRTKGGLFAVALLIAAGGTACGSSGGDKTITKADFVKQADAICTAGRERTAALIAKTDRNDANARNAAFTAAASESLDTFNAVRDLGYPDGDKARLDKDLSAIEGGLKKVRSDPTKLQTIYVKPITAATRDLKAYGMKVCGKGG